jgi:hypothetical protein
MGLEAAPGRPTRLEFPWPVLRAELEEARWVEGPALALKELERYSVASPGASRFSLRAAAAQATSPVRRLSQSRPKKELAARKSQRRSQG